MQAAEEKKKEFARRGAMQDVPHARAGRRFFLGKIKS
jgi:hypothetical protein